MTNRVVDLDNPSTWPAAIRAELNKNLGDLIKERIAEREHGPSGDRWHKPAPPSPHTKHAEALILQEMKEEELRVYHATRLLAFDEVRRDGLRPLLFEERIAKLRELIAQDRLSGFTKGIDEILDGVNLKELSLDNREAWVWATPLRRFLHDGGCDVFFQHWGGEADSVSLRRHHRNWRLRSGR